MTEEEILDVPPEEKEGDNAEAGGGTTKATPTVTEGELEDVDDHGDDDSIEDEDDG